MRARFDDDCVAKRCLTGVCLVVLMVVMSGCNRRFDFGAPNDAGVIEDSGSGGAPDDDAALGDACRSDSDCGTFGHCDASSGLCFECTSDADCAGSQTPLCDPELYRCVACISSADCVTGFECDSVVRRCRQTCTTRDECDTAHGCDRGQGFCIECDEDYECEDSPQGDLCAAGGSGCAECRSDDHCSDSEFCDALTGACVGCRDARDCGGGLRCDLSTLRCVAG